MVDSFGNEHITGGGTFDVETFLAASQLHYLFRGSTKPPALSSLWKENTRGGPPSISVSEPRTCLSSPGDRRLVQLDPCSSASLSEGGLSWGDRRRGERTRRRLIAEIRNNSYIVFLPVLAG